MPVLIALPVAFGLWLLAAWIANDTACTAINRLGQPELIKAVEKALLLCFI